MNVVRVLVKRGGVAPARRIVEGNVELRSGFGIGDIELAVPGRDTIVVGPQMHQDKFVPEVGQELQRFFRAGACFGRDAP